MKAEIITEMGIRYIEIPYCKEDGQKLKATLSEYEYNILEMAKIPGLISFTKRILDEKEYVLFPIYRYISLNERFKKESLDIELFRDFFGQLLQLYENMQTYLLEGNSICLDYNYIFYDEQNKKYMFLPLENEMMCDIQKYESLFTFFSDVCPIEQQELLGFIFESYCSLREDNFEPVSFLKYVMNFKFETEELYNLETEESDEISHADEELEEVLFEKVKSVSVFIICIILLAASFGFTYLIEYNFRYGIVGMAISVVATCLMALQVVKIIRCRPKAENI